MTHTDIVFKSQGSNSVGRVSSFCFTPSRAQTSLRLCPELRSASDDFRLSLGCPCLSSLKESIDLGAKKETAVFSRGQNNRSHFFFFFNKSAFYGHPNFTSCCLNSPDTFSNKNHLAVDSSSPFLWWHFLMEFHLLMLINFSLPN